MGYHLPFESLSKRISNLLAIASTIDLYTFELRAGEACAYGKACGINAEELSNDAPEVELEPNALTGEVVCVDVE